ncbi:hypothetical protein ROJ8625_00753 [Roseivivax jejudonensis]|uniref:DUF4864 domain-containing protein n=1 Tax=Roseivivax jejudonensis TaxID=1529041 RepID=A0A1X6YH08_9RHOB|nr:DUF4864 domain-containing protein [Roseivivax jejudonensis]SLN20768.1 hypothetical protein ROJ8625_00753 [Roseivivax jejudonensis]
MLDRLAARIAACLALCLALMLPAPATAQERPRDPDIEAVIEGQMEAFRDGDVTGAFDFAAPGIRSIFRTPEVFGQMVERGYPMVWQPGEVTFGALRERDGGLWQKVYVRDDTGALHVLDYEMRMIGDGWRIGGVQILEESLAA